MAEDKSNGWGSVYNASYGLPDKNKEQIVEKPTSTIDKLLKKVGLIK